MKAIARLYQYIEYKGIKPTVFEKEIGFSSGYLSVQKKRNADLGESVLNKLNDYCHDLSISWLLTGEGEMLKNAQVNAQVNAQASTKIEKNTPEFHIISEPDILYKKDEIETRPRIPLNAAAGSLSIALDGVTSADVEELPFVYAFADYNYTILVKGDSMEPEFHSGDEIACVALNRNSFMQWGQTHVLDTAQGIVVKRIYDNDDSILCQSENNRLYKDFSIPKDEIFGMGLVIGLIRRY